ncbi:hypothetical protein PILCRDRAFT_816659 [Piloderma croceum F 1598]|uniref:Glutathione transferase n=1 Tax=Piloderma croceum (strain F 1598) TaxID=765440 RepID=A0A0C3G2R5_PILCF|nr:hypothetical protein PILCRDRAFT_816659 [Piloderma croceum F 1598]
MLVFLSKPLSLYSIPLVWLTALAPAALKAATLHQTVGYNNMAPRSNTQRLVASERISGDLAARVQRMEGAHLNGFEILPLWCASILAGNFAGLDNETMNKVSIMFITTRILYNYVYVEQKTQLQSSLRSSLFWTALLMPMYLLIKAANKIYAAGA